MKGPVLFALVGVANTAVDVVVFLALTRLAGVDPLPASAVGYLAGSANSYLANGRLTFGERRVRLWDAARIARFALVTGTCLVLATLAMAAALRVMPDIAAKLVSVLVTFAAGYVLNNRLVYVTGRRRSA